MDRGRKEKKRKRQEKERKGKEKKRENKDKTGYTNLSYTHRVSWGTQSN